MPVFQSAIEDFRRDQYQYWSTRLKNITSTTAEKIVPILYQQGLDKNDVVLLVTGSDWRKENRPNTSSVEMIAYIYGNNYSLRPLLQNIAKDIGTVFMWYNRLSLAKKIYGSNKVEVEPKNFKDVWYFEDPYGSYRTIFPTRFMDGTMIYWSENLYKNLYDSFAEDLQTATARTLKPFKSRIKYAEDISTLKERLFKGKEVQHFDFDRKEIYYQKTPEVETGVKMWPLRYVQYKLAYLIIQLIKTNKINYLEFKELEGFIHKKIEFLRDYVKGGMPEAVVQDLSLIYYTFLKIHHICQKEYKNVEWVYIYQLFDDETKMLKEMLDKLNWLLKDLSVL